MTVYVDKKLYQDLIDFAPRYYGRFKGAISYVVEEALREFLYPRLSTQAHPNPRPTVRQVYEKVVEKLKEIEQFVFKPKETTEKKLEFAIAEVRGSDPRTVAKWKGLFEKYGLIKFVGGFAPNRRVELL
mgnify:CR=1 FL=1